MNPAFRSAQTNIQLYRQLILEGYSPADIQRVRETYDLAAGLFSGQFRGNGKTFIAHVVGVASVQTTLGRPVAEIQAGLLHSVYTFGDFGAFQPGFHRAKQDRLRATVGREVEQLVHAFHDLRWREEVISRLLQRDAVFGDDLEHSVILMRLAHEIEEHSDWAFMFDNKFDQAAALRRLSMVAAIAERLHQVRLAEYAGRVMADVQQAKANTDAAGFGAGGVYLLVPNSCRLRYTGRRLYRALLDRMSP